MDKNRKTLEKIFGRNLFDVRGKKTQAQMAELFDVAVSTYQRWEAGEIVPQEETRQIISEKLRIEESRLFADPDYVATPEEALNVLQKAIADAGAIAKADANKRALIDAILARKTPFEDAEIEGILSLVNETPLTRDGDSELDQDNEESNRATEKLRRK